jgi:integrase
MDWDYAADGIADQKLKAKAVLYRVPDGKGLALDVSPSGRKLWRWRYRHNGKEQILALGKYPAVSLAEARRLRDEACRILKEGKNPAREKKAQKLRAQHASENTFEAVARRCLGIRQASMNEKYRMQCLTRMEQHVFPMIGNFPIANVTIPDVVRVVEKIAQRGTVETAKRMKQLISQTFRYGAQRGLCTHNPAADLRDVLPSKPDKHHSCIPVAELPELLWAIDGQSDDGLGTLAMKFLALTFVRTGELIGARWDEIDWARHEWHIPATRMKMKRPHIVPLSRQALAILKEVKDQTGERDFVFFSPRSKKKHISNGVFLMALRRMGYQGLMTGHGFRTLASTILNERGYPPDVIERQLAHEDSDKIRAAYNRAEYLLERKKMMQDYADILDSIKKEKTLKVGKFRQAH